MDYQTVSYEMKKIIYENVKIRKKLKGMIKNMSS
jgi:hypothetical protein